MKTIILSAAAALLMIGSALAHDYTVGDLVITHPVARATPANAPVSGGYMTITNNGTKADRLISGQTAIAGRVEIHEMVMDGDVMQMRELDGGIEIAPGETVTLKPGGLHVMFMELTQRLEEGQKHEGTLVFENSGSVDVTFNVENLTQIRETFGGEDMDHSKMDHGHNHSHDHSGHDHSHDHGDKHDHDKMKSE